MSCVLRDIIDLEGCRDVVSLQADIWGREAELVPASVLLVSSKRGGILIGACDEAGPAGFVWSMPGWKDGRPSHWSHMLAVLPRARGQGLGEQLKRAQRARAAAQGTVVIEWTFDPLQAANAHLNFAKLGVVSATYLVNAYGEMPGPLHRGTATDRLIAEWWIDREPAAVARDVETPPSAITIHDASGWTVSGDVREGLEADTILIPVPPNFTGMLSDARDLAAEWRRASRRAFEHYLQRGYRVVAYRNLSYYLTRDGSSGVTRTYHIPTASPSVNPG